MLLPPALTAAARPAINAAQPCTSQLNSIQNHCGEGKLNKGSMGNEQFLVTLLAEVSDLYHLGRRPCGNPPYFREDGALPKQARRAGVSFATTFDERSRRRAGAFCEAKTAYRWAGSPNPAPLSLADSALPEHAGRAVINAKASTSRLIRDTRSLLSGNHAKPVAMLSSSLCSGPRNQ